MKQVEYRHAMESGQFVAVWENVNGIWSGVFKREKGHLLELVSNEWRITENYLGENVGFNNIKFLIKGEDNG